MKSTGIKLARTFGLIFIYLFIVFVYDSFAQSIFWHKSFNFAKDLAKEKNKLIIADFWADWCGPCIMMDHQVWNDSIISALAQNFISVRFDLSLDFNGADPYTVDLIPTIKILDYQGNVLYTKTGYADPSEMQGILSAFPHDVSLLYQTLEKCNQGKNDHRNLLSIALAYQFYAKNTIPPSKDFFIQKSDQFLKKAQKISQKENDYLISEQIDLNFAQNLILKGDIEKGKEIIIEKLESMKEENRALAYYILVTAFLQTDDKKSALEYYNDLKMTSGGEVYVNILQKEFK